MRVVDGDTGNASGMPSSGAARPGPAPTGSAGPRSRSSGLAARTAFLVRARGYAPEKVWAAAPAGASRSSSRSTGPAYQWPMYGANLARTQVHPKIKLRRPFRVVWKRNVGSLMEFPAMIWNGVGYVSNLAGYIHAIDLDNGKVLWKTQVGTRMAASPGWCRSNELVVPTMIPGELVVLNMETGRRKWTYRPAAPSLRLPSVGASPTGTTSGNVYAMDLERRRPKWVYRGGVKVTSSVAIVGSRAYFGDHAGRVVCLNARTGRTIWVSSAGSRVYGTPAVAGGRVFVPSVFSGMSALSARTGRLLANPHGDFVYSSPAVYRGRVYYGTYEWRVYSASARTGRVLWSQPVARAVSGAVQVVAGVVYASNFSNQTEGWHWHRPRAFSFPHGKYVAVSANAGSSSSTASSACLRSNRGKRSADDAEADRDRVSMLVGLAVAGAAAAWYYNERETQDIRGDSTREFVTTEQTVTRPEEEVEAEPWPMYGLNPQRTRDAVEFEHEPPFREAWVSRRRALIEFPPVIAYGRLYV